MSKSNETFIKFRALHLANEHRNAYGIRYSDYARYRKHCGNRTHRLRTTLKMTHGKGREFKKLPAITPEVAKNEHLQLLLFEAERAWAYAQDLIIQSHKPNKEDSASSLRHKATGRFRRAINWTTQLLSLCQTLHASSRLSVEDLLEITIYTLILNGRFLRFREEFDDALAQLCVSRELLDHMALNASASHDQALATLFSDDIGPEIRYCAHRLDKARSYAVDEIVKEIAEKHRDELVEGCQSLLGSLEAHSKAAGGDVRKKLEEIVWEGQPVPVRNPELVDALLKVQDAEVRLNSAGPKAATNQKKSWTGSKKGVAAYDAILLALSDAEEVARKLSEAQQSGVGASAPATAPGARDIHFVHAYIVYQLLSRRIQRDLQLVAALLNSQQQAPKNRPSSSAAGSTDTLDVRIFPALIKLLDSVLQSLDQMRTLSVVDDNPDLSSAIDARISFTRARRCLYLAQSYVSVKKYAEGITLTQHAHINVRETRSSLSMIGSDPIASSSSPFYTLTASDVEEYERALSAFTLQAKKGWFAHNGGSVDGDPKAFKKPTFYNIAFNYVQSDLMARLEERAGKQPSAEPVPVKAVSEKTAVERTKVEDVRAPTPEPKSQDTSRGGLSSLLGGWWGRS